MILILFVSFFVASLVSLLIVRHARHHAKSYDQLKPQRFHMGDIPRLGGVALCAGLLVGWLTAAAIFVAGDASNLDFSGYFLGAWIGVLLPALVAGVAEDLTQRLSVRYRLVLTGASAVVAIVVFNVAVNRLGFSTADTWLQYAPWLGLALAFLAVAGLPHAFNIIDGYNGIAGMVCIIVCLALIHVSLQVGDRQLAAVLVCLLGATAGFLMWNYPKGLIFAGDGGAYLWGVIIAVASLMLVQRHSQVSPWFPVLLLIYPIWETVFSSYRKWVRGTAPSVADALHFHQLIYKRLVRSVLDEDAARQMLKRNNRTSPYLWGFTLLTVAPAVLFWRNSAMLLLFCFIFIIFYVGAYLAIIRFKVPGWLRRG